MQVRSDILIALRLVNQARFSAGITSAIAGVRQFHQEMDASTTASQKLAASGNLARSSLGLLTTAFKGTALAVGALTAATIGYGIQFNATMESNALAFDKFAGGAAGAKRLTNDLFKIAASTPFSFEDITTGARRLLAFGFTVEETTDLLRTMGDAISYTGGSQDEIIRLGKALGDIRAKGRLMQQEMNQLANVGIPIRDILARGGLELTQKQLENIGRAGIPADQAIAAISAGLKDMYGGGAAKYLDTFNGQLQRLKDNLRQTAGSATQSSGLFGFAKGALKDVNDNLGPLQKFFQSRGFKSGASTVGSVLKTVFSATVTAVTMLWDALKPIQPFIANILWPLLKGFGTGLLVTVVAAFYIFVFAIKMLATALGFLGKIAGALGLDKVFYVVGYVLSFFVGAVIRAIGWIGRFVPLLGRLGTVVQVVGAPFRVLGAVFGWLGAQLIKFGLPVIKGFLFLLAQFAPRLAGAIGSIIRFGTAVRTKIVDGFIAAFTALTKLPGFVGPMMFRIGASIGDFLFKGMKERIAAIFLGGLALAASFGSALRKWLNDKTLFGDEINIGPIHTKIPALAKGGRFTNLALVGEQGPELAQHTPSGTVITPLRSRAGAGMSGSGAPRLASDTFEGGIHAYFEIPLYMDRSGRVKIAEAVGEYVSDRRSRA